MARQTPQLSDALAEYLHTRVNNAANTQLNDRSVLTRFVSAIGPMQIGHLTARHVEAYFYGPSGVNARLSPRSYNKVLQRVTQFLEFCRGRGYNRQSLVANVKPMKTFHRDRLRLSPHQMLRLLETADDPRNRAMLAVAMNLALRAGELTSLRVGDVNLASGDLHVVISKSGFEDQMPISSDLEEELRRWMIEYQEESPRLLATTDFLFRARQAPRLLRMRDRDDDADNRPSGALVPERPMTHPARVVQNALRANGLVIEPGEGFHTLRRSAARAFFDSMAAAGHDEALRMTGSFLHHSSSAITEVYLGLRHEKVKRDRLLKGQPFLSALIDQSNVTPLQRTDRETA